MPHSQDPSTPRLKQEAAYHNITKSPKMAQNAVVPAHKVDVSDISFSKDVKTLESGFKMVYGKYKGGSPIVLQLPTMKAPFGVSGWTNDKGVIEKYSLDLSFNGMDSSEKLSSTYELFKGIDDLVVTTALENSTEWFKKRYTSKEVMEAIARLAVNMAEAELIWANGYSENVSEQDVIDEATDDGRLDPSGLFWGDNTLDKIKLGA